jgi:hypothetical protein
MSGGAHEGPAPSTEFDLKAWGLDQVLCIHRACAGFRIVTDLYQAEKFRILHVCPASSS